MMLFTQESKKRYVQAGGPYSHRNPSKGASREAGF